MKKPLYSLVFILVAAVAIPAAGLFLTEEKTAPGRETETKEPSVDVIRSGTQTKESVPLEEYVAGVVAAEMPASFEKEALKAQAVAARTFILNQTLAGLDVTDTVDDQVFKDNEELKKLWGSEYANNKNKIEEAAEETKGEVLVYNGEPITAAFFSSGNGQTENAEDYWQSPLPYLISVSSPWDAESPNFEKQLTMAKEEVESKLGVKLPSSGEAGTVTKKTSGGRVSEIVIGGQTFTGREIREKLALPSADFYIEVTGSHVTISTKGYGHGVGMSQYGANGMAKEGKTYKEITSHYYPGASIAPANEFLAK